MTLNDLIRRITGRPTYMELSDEHVAVLLRIDHFDVFGYTANKTRATSDVDGASLMLVDPRKIVDLQKRGLVEISEPEGRRAGMVKVALTPQGLDVIRWYDVTRFTGSGIPARFGVTPGGLHVSLV